MTKPPAPPMRLALWGLLCLGLLCGPGGSSSAGPSVAASDPPPEARTLWEVPNLRLTFAGQLAEPAPWLAAMDGEAIAVHLSRSEAGAVAQGPPPDQGWERVIVQFPGAPLPDSEADGRSAARPPQEQAFLESLERRQTPYRLDHQYRRVFHGLALSLPTQEAARLRRQAEALGLQAVYPDRPVQATLRESVPLIGAPQVWALRDGQGLPATGQGVRVAVIDTGIDYTHPDLGGGIGPGHKVITGYNYIDGTTNPMDNHGHGTHVAGIIAANGQLRGVAPDAALLAYKVLDRAGEGLESDVMAAIERALVDGAHVINLSLGGGGNPNDPMSQAVDAAADAGAVVVVAAGNGGRYGGLDSPGVARGSLTVGASTKLDALASFSSQGPVPETWAIKPDLLAPGMDIASTWPGGRYATLSGTSMAAPHVAGAAALLRQLYPHEGAEQTRSRLTNTARTLALSPYGEGAGRVQALPAAQAPGQLLPPTVSLGLDDLSLPIWSASQVLTLTNWASETVTWTLRTAVGAAGLPAGMDLFLYPNQVTLGPGESGEILFAVTVDNQRVPDVADHPYAYSGAVLAEAGGSRLRAPFAFIKRPVLRLQFDQQPAAVVIHDRAAATYSLAPKDKTLNAFLPEGVYDVAVRWSGDDGERYVVREGVTLTQKAEVAIASSEARHRVAMRPKSEAGAAVPCNVFLFSLSHDAVGWVMFASRLAAGEAETVPLELWSSDLSPAYRLQLVAAEVRQNPYLPAYHFAKERRGLGSNWLPTNAPHDLAPLRQTLGGPGAIRLLEQVSLRQGDATLRAEIALPWPAGAVRLSWHLRPDAPEGAQPLRRAVARPWAGFDGQGLLYVGPGVSPLGPGLWQIYPPESLTPSPAVVQATSLPLGLWPVHAPIQVNAAWGSITLQGWRQPRFWPFVGPWGDARSGNGLPFEVWGPNGPVASGTLPTWAWGSGGGPTAVPLAWNLPAGPYTVTLPYSNTLNEGTAPTALAEWQGVLDTSLADSTPPAILDLQVREGNAVTERPAGEATVHFRAEDDQQLETLLVWYDAGTGWSPVSPYPAGGGAYWFTLPTQPPGAAVSLRFLAQDAAGNSSRLTLQPAYLSGQHRQWAPLTARQTP
ncbi:MAG: S8 family serine peptidase [Chloroflexi bacterium]|nr:S8 family serine peptidase [Chloroflexota bacterium]